MRRRKWAGRQSSTSAVRQIGSDKSAPLAPEERKAVLETHLPYRLYHLLDALERVPAKTAEDNQAFEAGAVAGRVLLEFLGVGYNPKSGELRESRSHVVSGNGQTDDVKVVDVDGTYVSLAELSEQEKTILCEFIRGVHKACAHLTIGSKHSLTVDVFKMAGPIIAKLYQKHVPMVEGLK